ncbi:sulfurtransferase [Corticibacter populi]|uniref:Sulfurtransferase n=1 Tax=Corticibacter populi TaxID=1550736 RepID=A0A3M6QY20_9BURK|nr:sulfurtransferase [Corticibacter populi]RMX07894.1 sulfurtransferase [Corticibacter populi]RZS35135.1 thiosulfate/3-mercaptopyruvate sulfurtransferase [Corticibacter populi]
MHANLQSWLRISALSSTLAVAGLAHAASAVPEGPLVSTEWLAENLDSDKVRVIEVSVNPGVYERGHIPGAVNFSWHTDLNDRTRRDIVSKQDFEKLLSQAGVGDDTTVVLYGDTNNWFAAWGAWVFDIYNVQNVKLLDGGRVKWEAESRPLNNRVPEYGSTSYTVSSVNTNLRARLSDALAVAEGQSDAKLVDIRSADEYSGKIFAPSGVPELAIRAGHIPTAVNVPWGQAVNPDGTFKSAEDLKKVYGAVGLDGSKPIITYCRIGERSSHTWFALRKILGYEVKNYDGSWTEYGNAVGVPIDNPSGTVWAAK